MTCGSRAGRRGTLRVRPRTPASLRDACARLTQAVDAAAVQPVVARYAPEERGEVLRRHRRVGPLALLERRLRTIRPAAEAEHAGVVHPCEGQLRAKMDGRFRARKRGFVVALAEVGDRLVVEPIRRTR